MKKVSIRVGTFILSSIMLISAAFAAVPATYADARASDYFWRYDAWVTETNNGEVVISFDVTASKSMTMLGTSQIVVQKLQSDGTWFGIKTYYGATTSEMLTTNASSYENSITFSGAPGSEYRAKVTFYAENNNGSDSRTVYTNSVVAK